MVYTYQQLAAPNDRNGNPRRLWVVCSQSNYDPNYDPPGQGAMNEWGTNGELVITGVITEGYLGRACVSEWVADNPQLLAAGHPFVLELPAVNVTATEYKGWIRFARESDSVDLREN
jgi:hypothetical protein